MISVISIGLVSLLTLMVVDSDDTKSTYISDMDKNCIKTSQSVNVRGIDKTMYMCRPSAIIVKSRR